MAAIRAAQLGIDVACIDENQRFGGTCLRVGCIPSKALLESSHLYEEANHQLGKHGVNVGNVQLDLDVMMARKDKIVDTLTGGIDMLFKKRGVTPYRGRGRFRDINTIQVDGDEPTLVQADQILICAGSRPARLSSVEEDDDRIGNSTTALSFPDVPGRLVVIGGGYIGLELGSVWNRLGSEVIVLEALDRILPGIDDELASLAHRTFKKQGIEFRTSTFVESAQRSGTSVMVTSASWRSRMAKRSPAIVSCWRPVAHRRPTIWDSNRSAWKPIAAVSSPSIKNLKPSVEGVYAIGDCIGGAMLAHKAMEEGIVCVERMTGIKSHINYDVIPAIVYTHPEIATVGRTEEQLKEAGIEYKKGVCPFGANGRARTLGDPDGRVKISGRCVDRSRARGSHHRCPRGRFDRRSGRGDGIRCQQRGHRPYLPRASDAGRSSS